MDPLPDVLRSDDIALRLGVSRRRVQQLAQQRRLPFVKIGRHLVVPVAAWERWLNTQGEAALAAMQEVSHADAA